MPAAKTGRKKGQKSKSPPYNLQLVQAILDASLTEGENIKSAAQAQGVPYSTLWGWTQRYPEARAALEANQAERRKLSRPTWLDHQKNRPPTINLDIINTTLDLIRHEGLTLTQAAKRIGKSHGEIWAAIQRKGLREDYLDAMRTGSHAMAESTLEILDDDSGDLVEQKDGRLTVNTARVRRDQARASQRMILAARANPEYYGPPQQSRAAQVVINIDGDKLQRIRDVSAATLKQIGSDDADNS